MENRINRGMKIIKWILSGMLIFSFLGFIVGESVIPHESTIENSTFHTFESEWVQELSDGSTIPIAVPGTCDVAYGEWGKITTRLSSNQEETWLCIRSMQQEMNIYVDDELRKEYSTLHTQKFGKTSTIAYVIFPLYREDAGKVLRIEFMSKSNYAGYVSDIYAGEEEDIRNHFLYFYGPGVVLAVLLFVIGLMVVVGSLAIHIWYKREIDLIHLGNAILIASAWLIVESKVRQFVLPSSTVAMWMGFLLIALLPYPFLYYVNSIQKGRYQQYYFVAGVCTVINFAAIVVLQVFHIKDFFETMTGSHGIIIAAILLMIITMLRDIFKGYIKEYKEVAIGFIMVSVAGICEMRLVYVGDTRLNGISLCLGLIALLFMCMLKSIRDFINVEKEKQMAIAASESKAQFLANMSHEIRTPINVVIGMNEMILRENQDKVIEEYANNIKSASKMLLGLINDVLDFSKIEAGKLQIIENEYELATILNDVILGMDVRAKQKKLEVKLDIDETMPSVLKGDEIRIKQILNNLLSNAVKYTEKGSVTFSAKGVYEGDEFCLLFLVKDTGIGIGKEDMEKLFDSFQRLELSKNRYIQGTGLGLNITKQLVSLMNGTLEVQSEYGVGSCFTVRIPQKVVDGNAMGTPRPQHEERKDRNLTTFHLEAPDARILVVDDNKMNLMVTAGLMKHTGIMLDTANGGMECLQMTKQKKYDLILMDHMMPEPDGVQTLHLIRGDKDNQNRETEVIVLTANAIEGMREQYLAEGFADYLTKPIEAGKLEEMIARYLLKEKTENKVL